MRYRNPFTPFNAAVLAFAFACGGSAAAYAAEPAPSTIAKATDAAGTTPSGHTFIVPAQWRQSRRGKVVMLEAPEAGSRVAFVEVVAGDAEAAVAEAWSAYGGNARPQPILSVPIANHNGWQDGRHHSYRTTLGQARQLSARAMRNGGQWVVRIDDLANAVSGRRAADLNLIRDEFLPAGHVRESFAGRKAHRLDAARIDALKDFVAASGQALEVPGISIGIVQDGEILFAGGFGVREHGKPAAVDADTLYLIASNTKSLTGLMLGKLIDEGRFDWETPVAGLLPTFRLADEQATARIRVKHLLCACAGLPYRNMDWEFAAADSEASLALDILARMRPTSAFATSYQYTNPIVAAAGLVGGHVAYPGMPLGQAYDAAMASRVFEPLGMTRTTFDFDRAMQGNYARSHGVAANGGLAVTEPARDRQMHAMRAAGGAWSNVNDMLAYLRVELSGGVLDDGRRYLSEAVLKSRWASRIGTGKYSWYGLGLETDVSSGTPMLFHGGRLYGQRSNMVWFPEHGVGLVILMNSSTGNVLMDALPRKLLEVLFDGQPEADSMIAAAAVAQRVQQAAWRRGLHLPARREHTALLAARYRNDLLGEIRVQVSGGQTRFDFGAWQSPVASRSGQDGMVEFVVATPSPPAPFVAGRIGERRTLTTRDAQNEYVFTELD